MTALCTRQGCACAAAWAPKLSVPAFGSRRAPLSAVLTLVVCEGCFAGLAAEALLTPAMRSAFVMQAAGRFLPDFDAARVERVALTSPEWAAAMAAVGVRH